MLEYIGVAVAIAGVYIAYLTLNHQRNASRADSITVEKNTSGQPISSPHIHTKISDSGNIPPIGQLPNGIVLGRKVVLIPGYQDLLFSHSGHFDGDIVRDRTYGWLQRGEVIGRYHMNVPHSDIDYIRHFLGSEDLSVDVKSPVDGLILGNHLSYLGEWPDQENVTKDNPGYCFSVLIADDEPPPETGRSMYSDACRFIKDHREPFFRHSRYWTKPAMTEEQFATLIDIQLGTNCLFIDAMPKFEDYLKEARTKYPSLRPHIKHLL